SNASAAANVEYPSPNTQNTGTTEHAALTIHRPEPHFSRHPSKSTTVATPLLSYYSSFACLPGWLLIFLACHWNAERHRIG
uniref:Glycoprotein N n=1 Tax=Mesocestoides corti TaxID=53468 RepID=A0A5K3FM60_MESCO